MLLVALCACEVYSAAIPEDAESAVQARPAPVAPAGVRGRKKGARQQQKNSAPGNGTVEGAPKVQRQQRNGQKKGVQKKGGKSKQQTNVRKGKINQNQNSKPSNANSNREDLSNTRNKNQFRKTPVEKLDRNLFTKTTVGEDEYVDYGAPQAPPAPGNRLVKMPNFAAHQKPAAAPVSTDGREPLDAPNQGNVRMMKPMPLNFAQKGDVGVSEPASNLDDVKLIKPVSQDASKPQIAILPYAPEPSIKSEDLGPSKEIMPFPYREQEGVRPMLIMEGPDFIQPNPDSVDEKVGVMQGQMEVMPVAASVAGLDTATP